MNCKTFNNIAAFKTFNPIMYNPVSQLITPPYKIKQPKLQGPAYVEILLSKNHHCKNEALNSGHSKALTRQKLQCKRKHFKVDGGGEMYFFAHISSMIKSFTLCIILCLIERFKGLETESENPYSSHALHRSEYALQKYIFTLFPI